MSLPPIEIPLGAMRFNSDSSKLEYWNGNAWFQIQTFSPNLGDTQSTAGARGLFTGGSNPSKLNTIDYVTISSGGGSIANLTISSTFLSPYKDFQLLKSHSGKLEASFKII